DLLVLDDFGLKPLRAPGPEDLYDVINERYERGSILLTSNRDRAEWPDLFGEPPAGVGRPRSPDPRRALRRDHRSELPRRAHQEAAHRTPRPRRQRRVGGKATTVMSRIRSRCHTGSIWATPSGSRWRSEEHTSELQSR